MKDKYLPFIWAASAAISVCGLGCTAGQSDQLAVTSTDAPIEVNIYKAAPSAGIQAPPSAPVDIVEDTPARDKPEISTEAKKSAESITDSLRLNANRQLMTECIQLKTDNELLSRKIKDILHELYLAQSPQAREEMIIRLLADKLPQVRLTGLDLAMSRAKLAQNTASRQLTNSTKLLLDDNDTEIRSSAAVLLAVLGDTDSVEMIIERLADEKNPTVRSAYIMSLGMLRDSRAVGAILPIIASSNAEDLTEALSATTRLLDSNALSEDQRRRLGEIIHDRYSKNRSDAQRGEMLAIMRRLNDQKFALIMLSALNDDAAAVKLEAINGLREMNITSAAGQIAKLAEDPDRGIRQAALETLGKLNATETLTAVLNRTNKLIEPDAAVRDRAWKTTLELLNGADNTTVRIIADSLAKRSDADEYRIRVLEMLSARLADNPQKRAEVDLELANLLISIGRPAQAAEILHAAHSELADSQLRRQLWLSWIKSLLAADDESSIASIRSQKDEKLFNYAVDMIFTRIDELLRNENFNIASALAQRAAFDLGQKLDSTLAKKLSGISEKARLDQLSATHAQAAKLTDALINADSENTQDIQQQILTLGPSATQALLDKLNELIKDNSNTIESQKRLLTAITALAPELTGFDINSQPQQKLEILSKWNQGRKNSSPSKKPAEAPANPASNSTNTEN